MTWSGAVPVEYIDVLPNLLDDLLKAWDAKATDSTPETVVAPPPVEEPEACMPEMEVHPAEVPPDVPEPPAVAATPMDALLSSLLASFAEPPPAPPAAVAAPQPEPEPAPEPVVIAKSEPPPPEATRTIEEPEYDELPDVPLPPPPPIRERETLGPIAVPQPVPARMKKFVAVGFGRHRFAFAIDSVIEAGRYPKTTYVPGLPPHIRGVFAFRGSVLPVVDTRLLTGAPERFQPNDCRVLTVQSGNARAAFVFDTLEGIVNLDPGAATPAPDNLPLVTLLTGVNQSATHESFGIVDAARLLALAGCSESPAVAGGN